MARAMSTPTGATKDQRMDSQRFTLWGWHLSYYTGKVLCYLRYKKIPHTHTPVTMWTLMGRIKRKTGSAVMPVLTTPQGEWLQDSSAIIDHLEVLHPGPSIWPDTPVQRFVASLMETWGDEWWVPMAMHTRWSHPENYSAFEAEAGPALLPYFPKWMQRKAVARTASVLRNYLPAVGVRPEQFTVMDRWTDAMLDHLDLHFSQHAYLLGGRPSMGDFGLVGTMYGHFAHDPWPARELIAPRPHLQAWVDRMASRPEKSQSQWSEHGWLAEDQIAPSLIPVVASIFQEFLPMVEAINQQVTSLLATWPRAKVLPRSLKDIACPMGQAVFHRAAFPYTLWMVQRTLDLYRSMSIAEQITVRTWLENAVGKSDVDRLLDLKIPRLRRSGLRVVFDENSLA